MSFMSNNIISSVTAGNKELLLFPLLLLLLKDGLLDLLFTGLVVDDPTMAVTVAEVVVDVVVAVDVVVRSM